MDECEPALMGKNLTGVKDSYIMLYIYKRQNVLFFCKLNSLDFCRGRRCKTIIAATLCVPESIADKLVCLHKCADNVETNWCADNVQTNWFVCINVQTICR